MILAIDQDYILSIDYSMREEFDGHLGEIQIVNEQGHNDNMF